MLENVIGEMLMVGVTAIPFPLVIKKERPDKDNELMELSLLQSLFGPAIVSRC